MQAPKIYQHPIDIAARLGQLGLPAEALPICVERGQLARRRCTAHHPASAPGIYGWAETTKEMRDVLVPLGWEARSVGGLEVVVYRANKIEIAYATGDEATGNPNGTPKTKYPKGPAMAAAIEQNRTQLELFEQSPALPGTPVAPVDDTLLWLLLVHTSEMEVRFELSLPDKSVEGDQVESWRERILFPAIPLGPAPSLVIPGHGPDDGGAEVIVEKIATLHSLPAASPLR